LIRPRPVFLRPPVFFSSSRTASRIPFTNLPLFSVLNVLATSMSSLIVTFGGMSGK
jgi:hypothetical protein